MAYPRTRESKEQRNAGRRRSNTVNFPLEDKLFLRGNWCSCTSVIPMEDFNGVMV